MANRLRSELLAPAGSLKKLKMAVVYGADAVYLGTPDMSLRTKSEFSLEEVLEGVEFAHQHGVKVYLTLNLFSHNKDIEKLPLFIDTVRKVKPDGLIIADPGVFRYVKEHAPELELHISTQANVCSWLSVKFWEDSGAKLVVMAREVTFAELAEIREKCPDIKLEAFVHGSMCMTYSGRCLLSNFMAERGANQGNCAHNCRWNYTLHMRLKDGTIKELEINDDNRELFEFLLEEEVRPGQLMPIEEDTRGSYILNSKDMCMMPKLNEYLELGVDSLKLEGRNKSLYYVSMVTRAYRMAMDDWAADPENWDPKPYIKELDALPNRGYTLAFHEGRLTDLAHNYQGSASLSEIEFAGYIIEHTEDALIFEAKNRLVSGDVLEFVSPNHRETILLRIYEFENIKNGKTTQEVHAGQVPHVRIPYAWFDQEDPTTLKERLPLYTVLRKERELTEYERNRIKLDVEARLLEMGKESHDMHDKKKVELLESLKAKLEEKKPKTPRIGVEGCCGKGCNGCMVFWNDPKYAKARDLMATKKMGERLDRNMRQAS